MNFVRPEPWTARSKCHGLDPDLFVPDRGQSPDPAIAVCNGTDDGKPCPVRRECAEYRVTYNCMGVWGGEFFSTKDWLSQERELAPVILLSDARPRLVEEVIEIVRLRA